MSRFKIGQDVVCVKTQENGYYLHGVKLGEHKVVEEINVTHPFGCEGLFIATEGCSHYHREDFYAPLEEDGSTKELAETIVKEYGIKKEEVEHITI